jgi:hypothetical protein
VIGMLKTQENGKQKILISSSITLRRKKMIKKWIIRPIRRRWRRFTSWLFDWQKKDD